ncbi:hypothetical protein LJ737_18680 [Hymenobacter sp. 15J16-1T3B]|uniref:hypothetical protein n=1 Tax=Hymenobacter sp. 15J16-1T3B TaxID=2886941 RepID=UPI001D0FE642|nr:hypothetical protein [Hymenobacter sp. 15J16-1T3B]MCC3159275.1 hypothetical protein [Hymenobacter sp. 15J16-1T3B]
MTTRITPALRRLLFIGGVLLSAAAQAQSPTVDPTFPPVQISGTTALAGVYDVARQPDGKYLIGGDFQAVNGQPVSNLARLNADGSLDAAFTAACAANGPVGAIIVQPDGKILVAGSFQTLGGSARAAVGRLLANGTPDASFAPNFNTADGWVNSASNLLLLPDGKVLATGSVYLLGNPNEQRMFRLDGATGQADPSFQFTLPSPDSHPGRMVRQPDGKVILSGSVPSYRQATMLMRVEANGSADASFSPVVNYFTGGIYTIALDGAGRIYAGGSYNGLGGGHPALRRYLANGTVDPSFAYAGAGSAVVNAVTLQPNGNLLVGSGITERVLPTGAVDATYLSANGPSGNYNFAFRKVLVEPSGAILMAGAFALPGTTGVVGLARLNAANVLPVRPATAAAERLAAWPVPTRDVLHLRATAPAQHVQLLDALGRSVRSYRLPVADLNIPVADLPAGTYQLRVAFTDGSQAVRRVLLQ